MFLLRQWNYLSCCAWRTLRFNYETTWIVWIIEHLRSCQMSFFNTWKDIFPWRKFQAKFLCHKFSLCNYILSFFFSSVQMIKNMFMLLKSEEILCNFFLRTQYLSNYKSLIEVKGKINWNYFSFVHSKRI